MNKKFKIIILLLSVLLVASLLLMVVFKKGDKYLEIKLDSNPTTGYDWQYEVSAEGIVEIEGSYKSECTDGMTGCGGVNIYKLKPLKQGTTTINFKYERSWEKEDNPLEVKYEITVDKNLNITEKHFENIEE